MRIYLAESGLQNLISAQSSGTPAILTGSQVGTQSGFIPSSLMISAQGSVLLDNQAHPESVKATPVDLQETIFTVKLDDTLQFDVVGNILIFLNTQPFLWLVSDQPFGQLKTDPVSHFAGDEHYFSFVVRYPYIQVLINLDTNNALTANFPVFENLSDITPPGQTPADQAFVQQCNLFYGDNKPTLLSRGYQNAWLASPMMLPVDGSWGIDGGTTLSGL